MARRTKEAARETRSRILDTAEQVFLKKGVSHTSLEDIADAAAVTRGAIYWHFKNKTDLFDAMMQRISLPMEEMMARAGDDRQDDPLDYVRRCALTVLERLTSDPRCHRVMEICCYKVEYVDELEQLRERHIECRSNCLAQIERGLRNAAKKGVLAPHVDPRHAAAGLHALVDGLMMNWVLDPKYLPLAKAAKPIIDGYIDGLRATQKTNGSKQKRKKRTASSAKPEASTRRLRSNGSGSSSNR